MRRATTRAARAAGAAAALLLLLLSPAAHRSRDARAGEPIQPAEPSEECAGARRLDATFLQLTSAVAERPRGDWESLFAEMRAIGITQVFLQWTWADGVAFYTTPEDGDAERPVLPMLLDLAAAHGMRVWIGLAHDAGWWAGIDRARPATEVEVFLARRRLRNVETARAIAPLAARHAAFAGWYVPDEIDDKNWLGAERAALVAGYLADVATALRALSPGTPVAVSGFGQGWATPGQLAAQWSAILARARLELVLFQDGVGAGKLTLPDLAPYLPALGDAVTGEGARLGMVVELFASLERPGDAAAGFAAEPAPLARIRAQLALDQRWATGPLVAFSVPDYMSAWAGERGEALLAAYRRWTESCAAAR